jgi:uncharacterized phage protein (TIGR02218 family)
MTDVWLEGPVTSAAYGWRLERDDGVTLGFTSHDLDILYDGLLLRASPGMKPTTIVESLGLENDGLDVSGALTSDAIRADDLVAGLWDSAYLEIFLFDWTNPEAERRLLANGTLGAVSLSGDGFEAEFLGLKRALERSVVPQTSPSCRARFCDAACGLNRLRFRHIITISGVDGNILGANMPPGFPANSFAYGSARFLEGANCGLSFDILSSDASSIRIASLPNQPIQPGTRIELTEGCDKQISTCANRFGNAINFRGEPYLPGNDLLTRYPGGS